MNWLICALDLIAAFVIICLMLETTQQASVHGFFHGDRQSIWAMIRRLVYVSVAIALFAKSVYIYEGRIYVQGPEAWIWLVLLCAIIIFPAFRALGLVDQDKWVGFHRN